MAKDIHEVRIAQAYGRWEVYVNGEFFCTADTFSEAMNEIWSVYD